MWVSPRQRAVRTFQLLFGGTQNIGGSEGGEEGEREVAGVREGIFGGGEGSVVVTEGIREWDYGEYEGMKAAETWHGQNRKYRNGLNATTGST